ncbi:hypothetical protein KUTeg_007632 [Tegillarca granosa]|uniref:Uncharacterized protein n=1 Tax=Tegillarca granosa TaxID=220873 RepID=A0ABQ9FG41_TEGGR|nr:hypothetical protein KUTeg_007632 [Tegillarca granosa]
MKTNCVMCNDRLFFLSYFFFILSCFLLLFKSIFVSCFGYCIPLFICCCFLKIYHFHLHVYFVVVVFFPCF